MENSVVLIPDSQISYTVPEIAHDTVPEIAHDTVSEMAPEMAHDTVPEIAPDTVPEMAPDTVPNAVLEVNTRLPDLPIGVSQNQLNAIIKKIDSIIEGRNVNIGMIVDIIYNCMKVSKTFKTLTRVQEINLIDTSIRHYIIKYSKLDTDEQDLLFSFMDLVLPVTYDVISRSKGGLFRKLAKFQKKYFKCTK